MARLMADHANPEDFRSRGTPKRGFTVIVTHLHLYAHAIALRARPVRRQRPFVAPDPVPVTPTSFRRVSRVDDIDRIDKAVVVFVELCEVYHRVCEIQCVLDHALGAPWIGTQPVFTRGVVGLCLWK